MSKLVENLKAARERMDNYRCGIGAAATSTFKDRDGGLEALAFLRGHLPNGFRDFREFESSRVWSRKAAYQTFDRAIAAAERAK